MERRTMFGAVGAMAAVALGQATGTAFPRAAEMSVDPKSEALEVMRAAVQGVFQECQVRAGYEEDDPGGDGVAEEWV